jgi:hypothetical protein
LVGVHGQETAVQAWEVEKGCDKPGVIVIEHEEAEAQLLQVVAEHDNVELTSIKVGPIGNRNWVSVDLNRRLLREIVPLFKQVV